MEASADKAMTGAILAGGSRGGMSGVERALLAVGGERLIERQIKEMRKLCAEIIVVANEPKPLFGVLDGNVRIITDYFAAGGPLSGMHAALRLARHSPVWVVGGDMPFVSAEAARELIAAGKTQGDAVIPIVRGRPVPLHGIYDKACAETAGKLLARGAFGWATYLGEITWQGVSFEDTSSAAGLDFSCSIGRREEYEQAMRRLSL